MLNTLLSGGNLSRTASHTLGLLLSKINLNTEFEIANLTRSEDMTGATEFKKIT